MPRFILPKTSRTDGVAREGERRAITGTATSTWYVLMAEGKAPRPIRLSKRSVGWNRRDLFEWLEARARGETWRAPAVARDATVPQP